MKFGEPGFNYGESNPSLKGDDAGYDAIHAWVRRRKTKPELCEKCDLVPPVDLANRSGKYLRDLTDWDYLCRRCHMNSDGRNIKLRESGKSRKFPDKICKYCGNSFHPPRESSNFCNRVCYSAAGGKSWKTKEKRA